MKREEVAALRAGLTDHGDFEPSTMRECLEGMATRVELALLDPGLALDPATLGAILRKFSAAPELAALPRLLDAADRALELEEARQAIIGVLGAKFDEQVLLECEDESDRRAIYLDEAQRRMEKAYRLARGLP